MKKTMLIVSVVFLVELVSCKEKEEVFVLPQIKLSVPADQSGFIRDITPSDTTASNRRIRKKAEEGLKLDALENGFDGLQIRVWNELQGSYKGKLFVFENKAGRWNAKLYNYRYMFDKNFQVLDSIEGEEKILQDPRSGWNSFANQLINLNILTLPDYSQLPTYSMDADASGVAFEYATKNIHRFYGYPHPQECMTEFAEARNIVAILKLIGEEFRLKDF